MELINPFSVDTKAPWARELIKRHYRSKYGRARELTMNRADSRQRILSSAIEVFAKKGKHRATIEEIASKAGVGKSVLYRNYHTKNDLHREVLEAVMEEAFQQCESAVVPSRVAADDVQAFVRLASASLEMFFQNPHFARIVLYAIAEDTDEFLSMARKVKSRVDGAKRAAFDGLLENPGAGGPAKGLAGADSEYLLTILVGMNLTYLLGKPIAETFLGMKVTDERALLDAIKRNVLDLWTYGISKGDCE